MKVYTVHTAFINSTYLSKFRIEWEEYVMQGLALKIKL
jgi:hypothetical protein